MSATPRGILLEATARAEDLVQWRWDPPAERRLLQWKSQRWSVPASKADILRSLLRCAGSRFESRRLCPVVVRVGRRELPFGSAEAAVRALLSEASRPGTSELLCSMDALSRPADPLSHSVSSVDGTPRGSPRGAIVRSISACSPRERRRLQGTPAVRPQPQSFVEEANQDKVTLVFDGMKSSTFDGLNSDDSTQDLSSSARTMTPRSTLTPRSSSQVGFSRSWSQILDESDLTPRSNGSRTPRLRAGLHCISASRSVSCGPNARFDL